MNPTEQAKLMVNDFYKIRSNSASDISMYFALQSSLLACDYLIETLPSINGRPPNYQEINKFCSEYWQLVKIELFAIKNEISSNKNKIPPPPKDRILKEGELPEKPKSYLK